jgi:DNA-binding HxlR family transcriptional regulator
VSPGLKYNKWSPAYKRLRRDEVTRYGQFCPVAKASEIIAERWTPLILRELLCGSHRFSELEHGLPRISRSLLAQRLRFLENAGLVQRRILRDSRSPEYHLTDAGQDLYEVIIRLGEWSHRWFNPLVDEDDLDPQLLLWDMHRRLHKDCLPDRRVVVQFDFTGEPSGSYWLILEPRESSVCWDPPGFEVDLIVRTDTLAMHRVWLGHQSFADALSKRQIELDGERELVRAFPDWLALSHFALVKGTYQATSVANG